MVPKRSLIVIALVLILAVPAWTATGQPLPSLGKDCEEDTSASVALVPVPDEALAFDPVPDDDAVDDALLWRLYDAFAGLDGFIDVQFMLNGPPRFVAYFEGVPPAALPDVGAPYPITAETMATNEESVAQPVGGEAVDPPLVPLGCTGLRPGTSMSGCTWAWALTDTSGELYMTTAGHCVGGPGARVRNVGTVVYRIADGVGRDFAVIQIDAEDRAAVDPSMCHWGGPTAESSNAQWGRVLYQYGYGVAFGSTQFTRPRPGLLEGVGATSFTYLGPQTSGDSGSPVRVESGEAMGVHTHGAVGLVVISAPGLKYGTRLPGGLAMAEAATGIDFQLLTAPVA